MKDMQSIVFQLKKGLGKKIRNAQVGSIQNQIWDFDKVRVNLRIIMIIWSNLPMIKESDRMQTKTTNSHQSIVIQIMKLSSQLILSWYLKQFGDPRVSIQKSVIVFK